ncbi:pyrroloquinoline quinone biosynthesis protein D [Stigmatella aurantiaca]|uniref:Pyrroloquinoline quinone biosynthesis protein D n=1 Tax=Stigmatella aurantiaca TaxID=41 RepID=A0A1H7SYU4_STIAU|nr:PqqD family protein [Stigmatella aurantiaca]SEL77763.1 pyrroloquinoline quinone biosynthesis protein D [Stigmatella aurantiaca]
MAGFVSDKDGAAGPGTPGLDALRAVPRLHPETGVQRVGGRLLAAGPDEHLHTFEDARGQVSEVAERIMELVDGRRTVAAIVAVLCDEFEVEPQACEADTVAFLRLLVAKKVLVLGP